MRILFSLAMAVFSLVALAQSNASEDIQTQLNNLASDQFEGRSVGTAGSTLAANYIAETFKSYKLKPFFETFSDSFSIKRKLKGVKMIAQIEGSDENLKNSPIIIGAHYDHIGLIKAVNGDNIANGANDNASGSIAVLQLAKRLKDKKPLRPILFVLFDAEEQGLLGSKHLAKTLKNMDITPYIVFNIEMIGVPMQNKPKQAYITGFDISNYAETFNKIAGEEALIYLPTAKKYGLFMRSDNYPFYQEMNIPAQTVSTFDFRNYEYYHHVKDEPQLMDAEHILGMVEIWAPVLEQIANHKENIIKLKI
jgi:Zn-dependent M28 family amino/carboxypeptidase